MVSERINRMKEKQRNTVPTFSAERARLATEAYEKFGGEPNVLLKAKMLDYIVTNMTVYIDDDDLIAGNYTDRPRCAPIFPEFASQWILDEIDTFTTRTLDQMTAEDGIKEEVIEILKRWEGKSFDEVTAGVCRPEAIEAMNSASFPSVAWKPVQVTSCLTISACLTAVLPVPSKRAKRTSKR